MALPGGGETHQRPAITLSVQVRLAAWSQLRPPASRCCRRVSRL